MPLRKDLDPIGQRVVALMDQQNVKDKEVAEHLGISVSALSHAFKRGALLTHINEIANFLQTTPEALLTKKPVKELERLPAHEDLTLSPNSRIVRLAKESTGVYGRGRYAVVGPPIHTPTAGDLIVYDHDDGYRVRRYTVGSGNQIVLLHDIPGTVPEVFSNRRNAPQMRVVLLFGEKQKSAQ